MEVNKETYEEIRKNSRLSIDALIKDYIRMKIDLVDDATEGLILNDDEMDTLKHLLKTQDSATVKNICSIIRKAKVYKS